MKTAEEITAEALRLVSEGTKAYLGAALNHEQVERLLRDHLHRLSSGHQRYVDVNFSWTPDEKVTLHPKNLFTALLLAPHIPGADLAAYVGITEGEAVVGPYTYTFYDGVLKMRPTEPFRVITFDGFDPFEDA